MKYSMSPTKAYLLGLWKGRRAKNGVGVQGHRELCETFLKLCLNEKLARPEKVKFIEGRLFECYFYQSSLLSWLESELKRRPERFRFKNEYSANYFAGLFDSKGGFATSGRGQVPFLIGDRTDEILLLRLGFWVKKESGKIAMLSEDFYQWIEPYLKLRISKKN